MYLNSENVVVFPLSKARIKPSGTEVELDRTRLLTEKSVSNIINQLIDTSGFVIGKEEVDAPGGSDKNLIVEFNLLGYYIRVTLTSNTLSEFASAGKIYASINIDDYQEIDGQDVGGKYQGLTLSDTDVSGVSASLLILQYDTKNKTWVVPTESHRRFDIPSLIIDGIDGKYKK